MIDNYDFEIKKVIKEIKKERAKNVLIQLPEGLKFKAIKIINEIESKSKARCFIWLGSAYGACDMPEVNNVKFDLLVHFGHSRF